MLAQGFLTRRAGYIRALNWWMAADEEYGDQLMGGRGVHSDSEADSDSVGLGEGDRPDGPPKHAVHRKQG